MQEITIGRMVHYKLAAHDISAFGAETNGLKEGDLVPAVIARVWNQDPGCCNLRLLPDGTCTPMVGSRVLGTLPGEWCWPARV